MEKPDKCIEKDLPPMKLKSIICARGSGKYLLTHFISARWGEKVGASRTNVLDPFLHVMWIYGRIFFMHLQHAA